MKNLLSLLFILFGLIYGHGQVLNFDKDLQKFKNQSNYDSVYQAHVIDTTLSSTLKISERITFHTYADSTGNLFCTNTKHKPDTLSFDSIRITDFGYRIELFIKGSIIERRYYSIDKNLHAICYFKNSKPERAMTLDHNGKTSWKFYKENDSWFSSSEKDNFDKVEKWSEFEMVEQMMLMPNVKITKPNIK